MRVLEPRILLDAAAVETALEIAGQDAHDQMAEGFAAGLRAVGGTDLADFAVVAAGDPGEPRRTDREIVFIDAGIEDRDALLSSLEPGVTVHVIGTARDGIAQIADALAGQTGLSAIHIFSHGDAGRLSLGGGTLDQASMTGRHAADLARIGSALANGGDILVYGCDFGQGEEGLGAARALAAATGADVAASDDLTGAESLAGDWTLEVNVGEVSTVSYRLPDWQGILGDFQISADTGPTLGHATGGFVGTVGTYAQWPGAVSYDPGGGGAIETYDLRATIIGASEGASGFFETVSTTDPTLDDMRVVVTNVNPVVDNVGGEDVRQPASIVVIWEVYVAGTNILAPRQSIDLTITDIDGLAGQPDTRETVSLDTFQLWSTTLEATSTLSETREPSTIFFSGTELGNDDPSSKMSAYWASANQFIVVYTTNTQVSEFDHDGDGDVTFTNPVTTRTQDIDLNGAIAGRDFVGLYVDGSIAASSEDVGAPIVAADMSLYDLTDEFLQSATVTLTKIGNDRLEYDAALLTSLGLNANYTDDGTTVTVELSGNASLSNYETALKALRYHNGDAAPDTSDRNVTILIDDGFVQSQAGTTIVWGAATGSPVMAPDVYTEFEDTTLTADAASGLLANDADPEGDPFTVTDAWDAAGNPITIGGGHVTPAGAFLTLNADGSFSYVPQTNYSGSEYITYAVNGGAADGTGYAVFDIQPVLDPLNMTLTLLDASSDEDVTSNPLTIDVSSPDPSEKQIIELINVPVGVIVTDGVNEFASTPARQRTDISDWDLSNIRVKPVEHSDADITLTVLATNQEADGSQSFESRSVVFAIDAVADPASLVIEQANGAIDGDVAIAGAITTNLIDTDGSETLTALRFANIPPGAQMLIGGVPQTITGGSLTIDPAQLPDLVFRPPATGADATYNIDVIAQTTETAPENGVTLAVAETAPVVLIIELNDNDDPVAPENDTGTVFVGDTVALDVMANDFIPDGGGIVVEINGQPLISGVPFALPEYGASIELDVRGYLLFTAGPAFSGLADFTYTLQDVDGSLGTANVTVEVLPRFSLASDLDATEGVPATHTITLNGQVTQGTTASVSVAQVLESASAADLGPLEAAIDFGIANLSDPGFSRIGSTIFYAGPPQPYGVTYDAAGSTFNDISTTGNVLALSDDGVAAVALGFDFPFYDKTIDTAYVSANGYVTFGSPATETDNDALTGSTFGGRPAIAPLWDDLDLASGDVRYELIGTEIGKRELIIQWTNVASAADPTGRATFQIVLSERGDTIRFNYDSLTFASVATDGASATIGLESGEGIADQHSHDTNAVVSGSSIVFTRPTADNPALVFALDIVDDALFETQESYRIELSNAIGAGLGAASTRTTIAVSDNAAPTPGDDATTTTENDPVSINVITNPLGTDTDPEGHSFSLSHINGSAITPGSPMALPSGAQVSVDATGNITFEAAGAYDYLSAGETADEIITYTVTDQYGAAADATLTITVDGFNTAPLIDLDDDGTSAQRDVTTDYLPTDAAVAVTGPTATLIEPETPDVLSVSITLSGFVQGADETIAFGPAGSAVVLDHATASGGTTTVGATVFVITYDGANAITITGSGGARLPNTDVTALLRTITYENVAVSDTPGLRQLTFTADDGLLTSAPSVATLNVLGDNTPPTAGDDGPGPGYDTIEETPVRIAQATLLLNDSDADGDAIEIVGVQNAVGGSAVIDGTDIVFTPALDFAGVASFDYVLRDARGGTSVATVTMAVANVNDAPRIDLNGPVVGTGLTVDYTENAAAIPVIDAAGVLEDIDTADLVAMTVRLTNGLVDDVLGVDAASMPAGVSFSVVPPEGATTGLTGNGTVTITFTGTASAADYRQALGAVRFESRSDHPATATRSVTVQADDGTDLSNVATAAISIVPVNDDPVAGDDGPFDVDEDAFIEIDPATLLVNDSDIDGGTPQFLGIGTATNGVATMTGDGKLRFVPNADYFGPAGVTYTISDGQGGTAQATVAFNVVAVNDAPVVALDPAGAGTDYAGSHVEGDVAVPLADLATTIDDIDSTTMAGATIVLTNGQPGDLIDLSGLPAAIAASAVPADALTAAGTITVTLANVAPIADYRAALAALTYRTVSDAPSVAPRLFEVVVNDGTDDSPVARSTITVTATNDAPVAGADTLAVDEDTALRIATGVLLANDDDPDSAPPVLVSVADGTNGTVAIDTLTGEIVFTPDPDYFGPATFTYTIRDDEGLEDTGTVTVTVRAIDDAPTLDLDATTPGTGFAAAYVEGDAPLRIVDTTAILADIDSATLASLTVTLTNGKVGDVLGTAGLPATIAATLVPTVPLAGDGVLTLVLTGPASLSDWQTALESVRYSSTSGNPSEEARNIEFVARDDTGPSNLAAVSVSVTRVNSVPDAVDDGLFSADEDTALSLQANALLFNDGDDDGDTPVIVSVQGAVNGTVAMAGTTITFTPDPDFFGAASFTYTIADPSGADATATVAIDVQPVNDAPVVDLDDAAAGLDFSTLWTEGGGAVTLVGAAFLLDDIDDSVPERIEVVLTNGHIGDVLTSIGVATPELTVTVTPSAGPLPTAGTQTLTITANAGGATMAQWRDALASLRFDNGSLDPDPASRRIEIRAYDGQDWSAIAAATVDVATVNDRPVTGDDGPFATDEDTSLTIGTASLTFNDSDPEGDAFSIVAVANPVGGTVSLAGSSISFTPDADHFGPASFEYTVRDAGGREATATVSIDVAAVNDAPTIDLDTTVPADGTGFLSGWTEGEPPVALADASLMVADVDSTTLTQAVVTLVNGEVGDELVAAAPPPGLTVTTSPAGPLALAGSQVLTLTASAGTTPAELATWLGTVAYRNVGENPQGGERLVSFRVGDGAAVSDEAQARVTVTPVNDAPIVTDDGPFAATEDTSFAIDTSALTFNDSDFEGETLTVTGVGGATNGTVSIAGTTVTFVPDADHNGAASFEYTVSDASGATSLGTVTLDVESVNDVPSLDLDPATAGTGYTTSYTENDPPVAIADPALVLVDVDDPQLAAITVRLTNAFVGDALALSAPVAGVTATTDAPVPVTADGSLTLTLTGPADVSTFASALSALTFASSSDALDPSVRVIEFTVDDGEGVSAPVIAAIAMTSVNDDPQPAADSGFTVDEDTDLVLAQSDLLANDFDPDGDALQLVAVSNPVNGTIARSGTDVIFTPAAGYSGPASFDYTVRDPSGATAVATVSISVSAVNDAPQVDLDPAAPGIDFATTYTENAPAVAIADPGVSVFDDDHAMLVQATVVLSDGRAGDELAVGTLPPGVSAGIAPAGVLGADGTITVTLTGPASSADFELALQAITYRSTRDDLPSGTRTIEVVLSDGVDVSTVARTTVTVVGVNDTPAAVDDGVPVPLAVNEDEPFTFDPVSANDTDLDGDTLTITLVDGVPIAPGGRATLANGELELAADGRTLTFTPALNYVGPQRFAYTVSDGVASDSASVELTVLPINDAPIAVDDGPVTLDEDTGTFFDPVTPNDSDVEGSPLDIVAIAGSPVTPGGTVSVPEGAVSLGADGRTLSFVPAPDFFGTARIVYSVSDGSDASDATITFEVTNVDDPLTVASIPVDRSAQDGAAVNWPMAHHFDDPDGDALLFTLAGAPAGLTIDATSGVISGVIDRSASLVSPYTLSVTASDGLNPMVTVEFTLTVTNPAPRTDGTTGVTLEEGAAFSIDLTTIVSDPDGDPIGWTVTGLPDWITHDGAGLLTGTVPADAAGSGPVTIGVAADDGEGGTLDVTLDIEARNVEPVVTRSLAGVMAMAGEDEVRVSLSGLFTDGGSDSDALTVSVDGLPEGVRFDPVTMMLVGVPSMEAVRGTPYAVTATAADGQGGIARAGFAILVQAPPPLPTPTPTSTPASERDDSERSVASRGSSPVAFGVGDPADDEARPEDGPGAAPLAPNLATLADTFGAARDDLAEQAILTAVNGAGSLHSIDQLRHQDAGSFGASHWIDIVPPQGRGSHFLDLARSLFSGGDDTTDERLDRFKLLVRERDGVFVLVFADGLDPDRDGRVVSVGITPVDGSRLPPAVRRDARGDVMVEAGPSERRFELRLLVRLDDGARLSKDVMVVVPAMEAQAARGTGMRGTVTAEP